MHKNSLLGSAAVSLMLSVGVAYAASPSTTSTTTPGVTPPVSKESPSQNTMSPDTTSAQQPGSASEAGTTAVHPRTGAITAEMTSTAKGFVQAAALGDMYQISSGNIALKRAQSPELKNYAQQMVTAHTQMNSHMKSLAPAGLTSTMPTQLDNRRQAMIDNLTSASNAAFDTRYIQQQMEAQNEARTLYHGYAKSGDDQALKQFSSETAPKIDQHLATIRRIERANIANADSDQPAPAPRPEPY